MFRLYDGRVRAVAQVRPGRGRELRLSISEPSADRDVSVADLRLCLLADLIRRTAQLHRLTVSLDGGDEPVSARAQQPGTLAAACAALNIHPPEDAAPAPNGADLRVLAAEPAQASSAWVTPGTTTTTADLGDPLAALTRHSLDPLALRLVFLEHHYRESLELTWPALTEADATLRDWRRQVAVWATHPSKPMCAQYVADLTGAFDDDLDTPAALRALRALAADQEIPPGSKFETAAHADQLLGLDVVSEVGRAV